MAQYGLETETTVHLKGMQLSDNQSGGDKPLIIIYKGSEQYQSSEYPRTKFYKCTCSGRYGYSGGTCTIVEHPDFVGVSMKATKGSTVPSDFYSDQQTYGIGFQIQFQAFASDYIILTPSMETLNENGGPLYDFSTPEPVSNPLSTLIVIQNIFDKTC